MSEKNISDIVNSFMIKSAPTLVAANPISYDLMKQVARQLIFGCGTTKEHATYVMSKKYGGIYAPGVVGMAVEESINDEQEDRKRYAAKRKECRAMAKAATQLSLFA